MTGSLAQALGALLAVVLLAWGAGQLARRRGIAGQGGVRIAVVTACAVDSRRRLVVIRCDGREALLLTGPQGDAMLGWLGQEPPA
jgi:flagellar protein FliO/FliZ